MAKRLAQALFSSIPLLLLAACSSTPKVQQPNVAQSTPGSKLNGSDTARVSPGDEADAYRAYSSDAFPRPSEIEPQVRFWRKVYSRWGRSEFAIHDKLYMNVIYEVYRLPFDAGESLTPFQKELVQQRYTYWKLRLGEVEDKLAAGAALSGDDQALVQQMRQATGERNAIFGASQRLRYQRGLKERFQRGLDIGSRYERQFRQIFRDAGLPEELAYLPHVESSFQFNAHSSAGALGVWQFTAGAARMFMNDDSPEARLDPVASTYGAARYLGYAYNKLGSWPLAVTSYNHGIGGMQKAKSRYGHDFTRIVKEYDHPQFGFASRNYYAEFLAALDVIHAPGHFFQDRPDSDSLMNVAALVANPPSTPKASARTGASYQPPVQDQPEASNNPPVKPALEEAAQAEETAPKAEAVPSPEPVANTPSLPPVDFAQAEQSAPQTTAIEVVPASVPPVEPLELAQSDETEQADASEPSPEPQAAPVKLKAAAKPDTPKSASVAANKAQPAQSHKTVVAEAKPTAPVKAAPADSKKDAKPPASKTNKPDAKKSGTALAMAEKPAKTTANKQDAHAKTAGSAGAKKSAETHGHVTPASYRPGQNNGNTAAGKATKKTGDLAVKEKLARK